MTTIKEEFSWKSRSVKTSIMTTSVERELLGMLQIRARTCMDILIEISTLNNPYISRMINSCSSEFVRGDQIRIRIFPPKVRSAAAAATRSKEAKEKSAKEKKERTRKTTTTRTLKV
jgi:hypothetical protein